MSLEYNVSKPKDLSKINVNDFGELLWWSYIWAVSPEKILTTIDKVGLGVEEIKKHIKDD
jgi:hypothetical protein